MEVGVRGTASLGNKMLNEEKLGGWSLLEMCGIIHSFRSLHPLQQGFINIYHGFSTFFISFSSLKLSCS